jgi:hypothetical protein
LRCGLVSVSRGGCTETEEGRLPTLCSVAVWDMSDTRSGGGGGSVERKRPARSGQPPSGLPRQVAPGRASPAGCGCAKELVEETARGKRGEVRLKRWLTCPSLSEPRPGLAPAELSEWLASGRQFLALSRRKVGVGEPPRCVGVAARCVTMTMQKATENETAAPWW